MKLPVFGKQMLLALSADRVSLNIHADSSPTHASNMRLFEATGMASVLVTESRDNLKDFFDPDREVISYSSIPDVIEKLNWLLNNSQAANEIASAGRKRVLKQHTSFHRAQELKDILNSFIK
jgi:spore maturation protein CgeB